MLPSLIFARLENVSPRQLLLPLFPILGLPRYFLELKQGEVCVPLVLGSVSIDATPPDQLDVPWT